MLILGGGLVAILALALRLVPGTVFRSPTYDSGYHLLLRQELVRHRLAMPRRIRTFALDREQTYPWLYHLLICAVPEQVLLRYPALPSAIIDALMAVLAYAVAWELAGSVHSDEFRAALAAGSLVSAAPALLTVGIGPRAYDVSPRPLGELLYSTVAVCLLLHTVGGPIWWVAAAAAIAGLAALASKFAVQVIVFTIPLYALATWDATALLVLPGGLLTAIALSRGRYLVVAKAQLRHLHLYSRRLQYDHPAVFDRNRWRDLSSSTVNFVRRPRDRRLLGLLVASTDSNTYVQFALRNLGLVWIAIAWNWSGIGFDRTVQVLVAWLAATLVPFLASSARRLRFLGEAERYPEYAVVAVSVLGGLSWSRLGSGPAGWVAVSWLFVLAALLPYAWLRKQRSSGLDDASDEDMAAALDLLPDQAIVLPVPTILASRLGFRTHARFAAAMDTNVWADTYQEIFIRYPWPSPDLEWWGRAHGVDHVLVSADRIGGQSASDLGYQLTQATIVASIGNYRLVRMATSQPNSTGVSPARKTPPGIG